MKIQIISDLHQKFGKHIFKLGNDEQTDIMMKLELK
ncbi:hypothetical protein ELOC111193_13565 [Elizabethkingia occulta]